MSRARDGGREPRKDSASRLISDQEQAGKLSDPLRFGPEREPESGAPKHRRPDWKKASARKVREATAPAEPERREDAAPQGDSSQPVSESPAPLEGRADLFPPDRAAEPVAPVEHGEPPDDPREAPRGPEHTEPRQGPAARLRFEGESPADDPGEANAKGPRPAGRGPAYTPGDEGAAPLGQSVPKKGGGKFRQESQQEQVNRAKFRMEQREAKLDKAKGKLAKQKPPRKKGLIRKAAGAAGWTAHGFVHGKIYENEHENVGIEGAHRSELAAEAAGRKLYRYGKRKVREHPAKAAQRAQSKFTKATADYHFRMAAQEQPGLGDNPLSRFWRKHQLKKQYRKQFRKRAQEAAKYGGTAAAKTATVTEKAAAHTVGFVKRHPVGVLLVLACLLIVVLFQSCVSSLAPLGSGAGGGIGATTYAARDEDILAAEAAYCGMEAELQTYLDNYTATHSYDEYHFDLDEIEHDPYVLISILSVLHEGEWTLADVEGTLDDLFDRQYILTERVVTETRYDENDEPYTYYICYVTLENFNLSHLPVYMMSEEQMARYALYMATLGNRPDLFPGSGYVDKYTQQGEMYEVPAEYMGNEKFAALLTEAEKYVGYPYVWGGSSPATSFDCSGYLSWVLNQCGWNVGRLGAQGLYDYCTPTSDPKPGDLVFFVGTYDTPGVSHCGLYLGDGMMLHCGDVRPDRTEVEVEERRAA